MALMHEFSCVAYIISQTRADAADLAINSRFSWGRDRGASSSCTGVYKSHSYLRAC